MTTTVGDLLTVIKRHLQEDDAFSSGLWSQTEIIGYVSESDREFLTKTGLVKRIAGIAGVASESVYTEPSDSIDVERLSWNGRKLFPQTTFELDNQKRNWKNDTGTPKRYHRDQLPPSEFEVWPKPSTSGTGYTTAGNYGTVRHVSGPTNYLTSGDFGALRTVRGVRNYYIGWVGESRPYGTLRQILSGATNFTAIYDKLPDEITTPDDAITTPDAFARYVMYEALAKAWALEGDGQDVDRSAYCMNRFNQGVKIAIRLLYGEG